MNRPETVEDWLRTILFLPQQASTVASGIDRLHMVVIITTMLGATGIALMVFYYILRYRRRTPNGSPHPREVVQPTPVVFEALMIVGLFALFFAWWEVGFTQYVNLRVAPEDTYDIYVTAKQWMWKFSYAEGNHTISELYVPAGRDVKLIMTSRDVIHSFYVPDFRIKQDVLPGRYTTLWFNAKQPGKYQILCAEYCGTNHSTMRGEVIALDPADFSKWLASGDQHAETDSPFYEEPSVPFQLGPSRKMSLERLGQAVAAQEGCLRCHTLDGTPHIGPSWAGLYLSTIPVEGGGSVLADEAFLTESMMDPNAKIHAGFKAVMPSYLGRLRPAEVGAMLQLIKALRGVRGTQPHGAQLSAPPGPPPAGAMGQPPGQPEPPPLLQAVPSQIGAASPEAQGLPPPGAPVLPQPTGTIELSPQAAPSREKDAR